MKTPKFWQKKSTISTLLLPLGLIYSFVTELRISLIKPKKVSIPVICVGNLTAGGTGKTPVSISLANLLKKQGYNPFFLSRGYGGSLNNILVDKERHNASEVGDEPLLLSEEAPVIINGDRYIGAKLAIKNGADILIMDDGFQNPGLYKDLSFIVVDGGYGFGNERPIPSGPLRESLKKGFKRAHALIIVGEDSVNASKNTKIPTFKASIISETKNLEKEKVIAFAGIGRPEKFYNSLIATGCELIETIDFPDHHFYLETELENIISKAFKNQAKIYTTSKDFIKIPKSLQKNFNVLEIKIYWEKEEKILDLIKSVIP